MYFREKWSLKQKDNRKWSVFENDCFRTIIEVSHMKQIKMDQTRNDLKITHKITDIIKEKKEEFWIHSKAKIMPVMSISHTRTVLLTEDPRDDHKNHGSIY